MLSVSVDINGAERGRNGTGVFAGATANANAFTHFRYHQSVFVGHHLHRLGGTVFRAGPAVRSVGVHNAIVLNKNCHAQLGPLLFLHRKWQNGTGGTGFGTFVAVEIAIAGFVIHKGLQYVGGTGRYAEGAGRADLVEARYTAGPRRCRKVIALVADELVPAFG